MSISLSIIVATKRGPETLKHLFVNPHSESELIIIDSNYNNKTKKFLKTQEGEYKQIVYAPCKESKQNWMRDFSQSLNTAICYVENEWIVRADDYIEFKPDFFDVAESDIKKFTGQKFIVIGQKALEFNKEEKFVDYMSQRGISPGFRYITIQNPAFTFSFGLMPLELVLALNGFDERYDTGYGFEDRDFLHRLLAYDYKAILDKQLFGYGHYHITNWNTIRTPAMVYEFTQSEIENGKYYAFNSFVLKNLRKDMLKEKEKWIIK